MKLLQIHIALLFIVTIVTACSATTLPEFDASPLLEQARATADVAIASTRNAESTAIASQGSHISADAENGALLFTTFQADAGFACSTCHWSDSENPLIGPGLLNIANRAETRVEGTTAYDYIYTSIVNPDAYIVETFSANLMPENWTDIYTDAEINDIIAYLWTLNGD